jgi:hypothetical protein
MKNKDLIQLSIGIIQFLSNQFLMAQLTVYKEPHHKIVYSNEFIRIIDLRLLPGDTTLVHTHDAASAVIFLTSSRVAIRDQGKSPNITDVQPGNTVYRPYDETPVLHTVWVEDHSPFRCLVIESIPGKDSLNACKSAPIKPFHLLWMQKSIEAYEAILLKGENSTLATFNCKYLLVVYNGKLNLGLNGARHTISPGEFLFIANQSSMEIEAADTDAGIVLLKIK